MLSIVPTLETTRRKSIIKRLSIVFQTGNNIVTVKQKLWLGSSRRMFLVIRVHVPVLVWG